MSNRRRFLHGAAALGAVSVAEWLGFFRNHGVPGSPKDWGFAKAHAQSVDETGPRYLIYWFVEGGWQSYSLFSPVDTPNHSTLAFVDGDLNPSPPWSEQFYRTTGFEDGGAFTQTLNGMRLGFLAEPGADLLPEMTVLSSHEGSTFHSGSRLAYHYGDYSLSLGAQRGSDERSVLQAFCEAKGDGFLLPHISWHRWLSDGELDLAQYPPGTGYAENLGPPSAHTVYGRTPANLRARLQAVGGSVDTRRRDLLRAYADDLNARLLADKSGQSTRSFTSALEVHRALSDGDGGGVDLTTLFTDPVLREEFNLQAGDEETTSTVVNGNPARSKETPHIRVQSMMAYELMRAGVSCGFWLENRKVRGFDDHTGRRGVLDRQSQPNTRQKMIEEVWDPLRILVGKLKTTECPGLPGRSLYDQTTIVLCSEMGRTISGNVDAILQSGDSAGSKFSQIMDQDVAQHWHVNGAAFLGGSVRGGRQFGRVGSVTLEAIPLLADGSLDPAFDPITGLPTGATVNGIVPTAGHLYATALRLAGVNPAGVGRNESGPLTFI